MQEETTIHGVRKARLSGREGFWRLVVSGGILRAVEPDSAEPPAEGNWLDAEGGLVTPPFVDAHFHLDSVHSLPETGENRSGTLLEGIELWRRHKLSLRPEGILDRARRYCAEAAAFGLQAIRSHVDVSYENMAGVEALLALREEAGDALDLQFVAFPQDGLFRNPRGEEFLLRALDAGIEVVGGIPHFERTYAEGTRSVDRLCRIAAERGLRIDFHCDETDDPASRHVETLAERAIVLGLVGRASASHTTSLHGADDAWFAKLLPLLAEAEVTVIPNPLVNLTLQARFDGYPKRRGITRIPELDGAGVRVALGQDCVRDPWYPLGTGNLLDVAHMTFHAAQTTGTGERRRLLAMITSTGAEAMGFPGYALRPGEPAHFLLFREDSFDELLRLRPRPRHVFRHGRIDPRPFPSIG